MHLAKAFDAYTTYMLDKPYVTTAEEEIVSFLGDQIPESEVHLKVTEMLARIANITTDKVY